MSVTLITNPVETVGGVVNNLFAGFEPVEFVFKREDGQISGVGEGVDSKLLINTLSDLSSYLSIGDFIYINSSGLTYDYDISGKITAITSTTITTDQDYIESTSGGYINYLKNYYLEVQLVNVNNSDINILPFSLIDDGDNAGNITIDVSIANDLNIQFFEFVTQELTESRVLFKVQYREVWDENLSGSYTLIENELILVYATEQMEVETFVNQLDNPTIWKGYPNGVVLAHSSQNNDATAISFSYDELDINQSTLVSGTSLGSINADKEGFIFVDINKDTVYNASTEYIKINADYTVLADFSSLDFSSDFNI